MADQRFEQVGAGRVVIHAGFVILRQDRQAVSQQLLLLAEKDDVGETAGKRRMVSRQYHQPVGREANQLFIADQPQMVLHGIIQQIGRFIGGKETVVLCPERIRNHAPVGNRNRPG
jgi:hypothetical protein